MKPLLMAAAFAAATFAQPWQAGDTLYQNTTQYANQYLAAQVMNFDLSVQDQIMLAMYCRDDASLMPTGAPGMLPACGAKAATPSSVRRARPHAVRKASPARERTAGPD